LHLVIDARLPNSGVGGVQNVIVSFAQGFGKILDNEIKRSWLVYDDCYWILSKIPSKDKIIYCKRGLLRFEKLIKLPLFSQFVSLYLILVRNKKPFEKLFERIQPDLVILPFQNSLNTDFPYVFFPHDFQHEYYPEYFSWLQKYLRRKVWRRKARNAKFLICETELVKSDLIKYFNIDSNKIEILVTPPNSININSTKENIYKHGEGKTLYYPAAFWKHKNHKNLIKSFEYINFDKYKLKLILSGSGVKTCHKMIQSLPISIQTRISSIEHVERDQFEKLFASADAIILPSLYESLSLVGFEALVNSKPILCSDIAQFRFQMSDKAIFFNPNDPRDIALKIEYFLDNENFENYYYIGNEDLLRLFVESFIYICQKYLNKSTNVIYKDSNSYMNSPRNFFQKFQNKSS
jgi:glycosyltransferase involved in cell wall biosynthesis